MLNCMFLFSPDVSAKIAKLVSKFYCQETVELPVPVGDFRPVNFEALKHSKEENKGGESVPVAGWFE